jgi:hypothetical protein
MKYRAIREHSHRFRIRLMCRALAGYYAWRDWPESRRSCTTVPCSRPSG